MNSKLIFCLALVLSGGLTGCSSVAHDSGSAHDGAARTNPAKFSQAEIIVEEMRGLNMQLSPTGPRRSDGTIIPVEQRKRDIIKQLRAIGKESVPALIHALTDPDVQMRRNAELAMIDLAGAYYRAPKVDIREALPALVKATEDGDGDVRAWAAHALAEIGPDAKAAVPALIRLVRDPDEGCRNDACIALGDIGPAAKYALPALRNALNDPSKDVRQFAKRAMGKIQMPNIQ